MGRYERGQRFVFCNCSRPNSSLSPLRIQSIPRRLLGQLIQFNSLDQLTQIKQILATGLAGSGSGK